MPDYDAFLDELDRVWAHCARVLLPGRRICCVVGDVCVSRRKGGRHFVMPLPLAYRLIRMFSFVGDTVLDPFVGTGSAMLAAIEAGRNSIGVEVDPAYIEGTRRAVEGAAADLWGQTTVSYEDRLAAHTPDTAFTPAPVRHSA